MTPIESLHEKHVKQRRVRVLGELISRFFGDTRATVLDIGCGDGAIAKFLTAKSTGLSVTGIDTLVRSDTAVTVNSFDGQKIPYGEKSFDYCLFVDVLHHAEKPLDLLCQSARIARRGVIIKDHYLKGLFAKTTLRFMDNAHNRRYGVSLPYRYWTQEQWAEALSIVGLQAQHTVTRLGLYPPWADWFFGRGLHFLSLLRPCGTTDST